MRKIVAQNDFGEKETFEKWNGKFYTEDDLSQKIDNITENTTFTVLMPLLMKRVYQSHM